MISYLYQGSVKNLLGPVQLNLKNTLIFEYTDAFSVFDWGRMPDPLPQKGEALAILAAEIFEKLGMPETWKDFLKTSDAQALREENRLGIFLNQVGEELQSEGLKTHYLGVLQTGEIQSIPSQIELNTDSPFQWQVHSVNQMKDPFRYLAVEPVSVIKPTVSRILGQSVVDYQITRNSPLPRMIPLEFVFRWSVPEGSSLMSRVQRDSSYLATLGYPHLKALSGVKWKFPLIETFTKLESTDRPLLFSEALAISGLTSQQFEQILCKTVWVASWLKFHFSVLGMELADGKLEWAITHDGVCFLMDAIGPDELRILKDGVQLSKEFLRAYYRDTSWYQSIENEKAFARTQGESDWRKKALKPPALPDRYLELGTQIYISLTNALSEKNWFPHAWGLNQIVEELKNIQKKKD